MWKLWKTHQSSTLAKGVADTPDPGEKSKHLTKADAPIADHDLTVG
jgi:hypothetical protein